MTLTSPWRYMVNHVTRFYHRSTGEGEEKDVPACWHEEFLNTGYGVLGFTNDNPARDQELWPTKPCPRCLPEGGS